jgi:GNAT superfamily N-acetyltransferase
MRLREFAPSPERDGDEMPDQLLVLANRWWNATDDQPQIEHVLNSLGWSIHQVESEDDAVQLQHRDGTTYFISADEFDPDLFESKTLDPELYGEMLPTSTVKRIVAEVIDQVDPGAKVSVKQSPEGYYIVRGEKLRLDFGITADGGDINANIVNAYSSYKGAGVVTKIFGQCFEAAEQLWGKPEQFVMSAHEDRGHGVWQAIAQKLGASWGGSVSEIARIPQGDFGDKDTLAPMATRPKTKPLPGGSQFSYAVNKRDPEFMEIMIFDGDTLAAELDLSATLDPLNTWIVDTVAVDPDYRGQGLGKALYGIALTILKLTLEAGSTQTQHGQRMWIMLNSIPGVEVLGYAMARTGEYQARPGDDIVDQNDTWTRYTFPVEPGKRSMRSTRRGTGIYSSQHVSMIAQWRGQ